MRTFTLTSLICMFTLYSVFSQESEVEKLMQQDWANLKKYRSANERIQETTPGDRVVFMGNSITEGWVRYSPKFFSENNFVGRGISGQTTPQMLVRFVPDVIDLAPEVVVILAGTNDVAGNTGYSSLKMITDNIKAMTQLATANGIEVILSSVLPAYDYPWRPGLEPAEKIRKINSWLQEYATENGHIYLDYYSHMVDDKGGLREEFSEDGVHPNGKGYAVMEPLAKEAIRKALNK